MSHLLPRVIETEAKQSSKNASGKRRSSLALVPEGDPAAAEEAVAAPQLGLDVLVPDGDPAAVPEGGPSSPQASQLSLCGLLASGVWAGAAGSAGRESSAQSMADRRGGGRSAEAIGADAVRGLRRALSWCKF